MSLEHILLGLLRQPASGYDLKRVFDERIHYFWAAELSQIYPTLQGLERKGLLRSRPAPATRGPRRRVYHTTRSGYRALREWLESGFEVGDERIVYLAKLYLMGELGDTRQTLRFLKDIRDGFARRLSALEVIERRWAECDPQYPDSLSSPMFHVLLTLRNGICVMGARQKWCDESIGRVEARLAKEGSHVPTVPKRSDDSHRGGYHRTDPVLDSDSRKQRRPAAR